MEHTYNFHIEGAGMSPNYDSRDFYFVNYLFEAMAKTFYEYELTAYHLQEEGKSWIVTDLLFEYYAEPLMWMEAFDIKVGFRNTDGLRIACDLEVFHNDKKIAQSTMNWVVIDVEKRRPIIHPDISKKLPVTEGLPYENYRFPKLKNVEAPTNVEFPITYSLIDFNHHLNSYHYFRMAYDALALDFIEHHYPTKLQVKFVKEIRLGEKARIYASIINEHTDIQINQAIDNEENLACKMSVDWKKR